MTLSSVMDDAPTARVGRAPLLAAVIVPVITALIFLGADRMLGQVPAFLPAFLALVWGSDLLTAFLLITQFLAGGDRRLLALSCAYLWSAAVIVPHALVFSGLFAPQGLLGATPSSAPWLWTAWHTGFPLLIGLALGPWPRRLEAAPAPAGRRWPLVALASGSMAAGAAVVAWLVTAQAEHVPVIMVNGDYRVLTERFGAAIIAANAVGLLLAVSRFRSAVRGLEAWAVIAVIASCGDVLLTLFAGARFTFGWYGARLLALIAALVVFTALMHQVTALYRRVRRHADELAARNAQLRQANALRDHLVAVVSHELRSPLTAVRGFLEIIEDHPGLGPERTGQMIARSQTLLTRLTMLTEDLLTVPSLEAGGLRVEPQPVDLRQAMAECAALFPEASITVDCPAGPPVLADPLRLQQIIGNYVRNALKYGAPPVLLQARFGSGTVDIRVRDHGTGVPERFVPRLFERFSRADDQRTRGIAGTGLGLSIVASLAEAHGGRAWYDPGSGPGACFVVTLPLAVQDPAPAAASRHEQPEAETRFTP
ncbi:MASE4 domain-containing protein [Planomonospora sp. ID91781]|nr:MULTISPECIES: MASE4 domain-containing protein [Planomonospora]MBG0822553.1 MASE4 domain-containing protein [Planomonospora sp. ID91781]